MLIQSKPQVRGYIRAFFVLIFKIWQCVILRTVWILRIMWSVLNGISLQLIGRDLFVEGFYIRSAEYRIQIVGGAFATPSIAGFHLMNLVYACFGHVVLCAVRSSYNRLVHLLSKFRWHGWLALRWHFGLLLVCVQGVSGCVPVIL